MCLLVGGGACSRAERDGLDTVSGLALAMAQEMATCHLPRAAAGAGEIIVISWLTKRTSQETYIYCIHAQGLRVSSTVFDLSCGRTFPVIGGHELQRESDVVFSVFLPPYYFYKFIKCVYLYKARKVFPVGP